ncbi:pentapeptide repeat-containing protein [Pasteurella multocida]|uniref:pentapeptide repeat-containing protein n=1 Tax=Pasteurella multocida TaxID=747 RepID=UPI00201FD18B|nr:pentapeptide repeat-containing protein [Pasteurella multocida]MCL7824656.1 pentapeptide repeat-containing protein [Pasteurella multocida]
MLNKFLNKLDQFFLEINDYWEDKKGKIKFWFVDKVQAIEQFSNPTKVILASLISFCIYRYFTEEGIGKEMNNAYWTLATLFISSPVAFIIWHFRDKNITQQIENQRKDINLKEFQKIAEWVSGLHFIEDEVTEKIVNQTEQEITRKYTQQSEKLSIPTFSKKDGAVGLQIAAIYNLLPFYSGVYGESFKKPALNLLLSAWLALQQKEVKNLENLDILTNSQDFDNTVKKIQENGRSPIGIAITHVLLADGGEHLVQYPEVFPNLCLAGMDFHLPGLDKNVLSLFINIKGKDCSGINLIGVNLNKSHLDGANLEKAILNGAILNGTSLNGANLEKAILNGASLNGASLNGASLNEASLNEASLNEASLNEASLNEASLNEASLNEASLEWASLNEASLEWASLEGASLEGASLAGAIFTYDTNNINWADLKSKGGVILYFTESERKDYIHMQLAKGENTFNHIVPDNINIEKTQQENLDWKIYIIKKDLIFS